MHIEQVQRWVITALVSTMAVVWIGCQMWAAIGIVEPHRTGARVVLLVIAVAIGGLTITGLRLLHRKDWRTPLLLLALVPLALGLWWM